jgi:mono/diheme cytochrome c family protein
MRLLVGSAMFLLMAGVATAQTYGTTPVNPGPSPAFSSNTSAAAAPYTRGTQNGVAPAGGGIIKSPHDFANYGIWAGTTNANSNYSTASSAAAYYNVTNSGGAGGNVPIPNPLWNSTNGLPQYVTGKAASIYDTAKAPANAGNFNPTAEICIVCHIPHGANNKPTGPNAAGVAGYLPLWNRQLTQAVFTPYSSATMKVTPGQPMGVSLLCLSCHDGTVALDQFKVNATPSGAYKATAGNVTGWGSVAGIKNNLDDWSSSQFVSSWFTTSGVTMTAGASSPVDTNAGGIFIYNRASDGYDKMTGTDLSNDHPISFSYNGAIAGFQASGMNPQLTPPQGDLVIGAYGILPLYSGQVECATCHAVHNSDAYGNTMGGLLLRIDNTKGSALCLNCHQK